MLGGLPRALSFFPEPVCFPCFCILCSLAGLHCTVCHSSLRVLLLPPLLACGFVVLSCRGLPPHIKLHSPWRGGEWSFLCGSLCLSSLLLLLFLLRVRVSSDARVVCCFPVSCCCSLRESGSCVGLIPQVLAWVVWSSSCRLS